MALAMEDIRMSVEFDNSLDFDFGQAFQILDFEWEGAELAPDVPDAPASANIAPFAAQSPANFFDEPSPETNHELVFSNSDQFNDDTVRLREKSHDEAYAGRDPTSNFVQTTPEDVQRHSPYMCTIHGLPENTTLSNLCSPSYYLLGLVGANILDHHPQAIPGQTSALLLFSTQSGAETAKESIESIARLLNKDSPIRIDLSQDPHLESLEAAMIDKQASKGHQFSKEERAFLEQQFNTNSTPSADDRQLFATVLQINEKRIQTWFNNQRQRLKAKASKDNDPPCEIETKPLRISRKRLSQVSYASFGSGASPIERFRNSIRGCEGEPGLDVIAAAARLSGDQLPEIQPSTALELFFVDDVLGDPVIQVSHTVPTRYARSIASVNSNRSCGSGLSAGRPRSGISSMLSWESRRFLYSSASQNSHGSRAFRISRKSKRPTNPRTHTKKSRASTKTAKIRQAEVPPLSFRILRSQPEPVSFDKMDRSRASTVRFHFHAQIEIECYLCHHFSEIVIEDLQNSSFHCSCCSKFLGNFSLPLVSYSDILMNFVICCHACNTWQSTNIANKELLDFVQDYPVTCALCPVTVFTSSIQAFRQEYECTVCDATFRTKYAWERHGTTLHEPDQLWTCKPDFITVVEEGKNCLFCGFNYATVSHYSTTYRFAECRLRLASERSFCRKDQLVQHLRGFHHCITMPHEFVGTWKNFLRQAGSARSCGICGATFTVWSERLKHVGKHWDDGLDLRDWKWSLELPDSNTANSLPFLISSIPPTATHRPISSVAQSRSVMSGLWSRVKSTTRLFGR